MRETARASPAVRALFSVLPNWEILTEVARHNAG
jgi:hypothetical protein